MIIKANSGNGCLIDIIELSRSLGVAKNTLYDWCAFGRIPHIKLGKFLRFTADDINTWLADKKIDLKGI